MQERHMDEMMWKQFTPDTFKDEIPEQWKKWSDKDATALKIKEETTNLPEGMRTPTPEELKAADKFGEEYRKAHPKASMREVRRAVQRKFNIQILPNT